MILDIDENEIDVAEIAYITKITQGEYTIHFKNGVAPLVIASDVHTYSVMEGERELLVAAFRRDRRAYDRQSLV